MDSIYRLPFQYSQHPYYEKLGKVKALETIRFSINTHRGCYGECNFCAIAVHEGRTVSWRSKESILEEARRIKSLPGFNGYIHDLGGPTANMYGFECTKKSQHGLCESKRCIYPEVCKSLPVNHHRQIELLREIAAIPGIKKVFVASGIRYDMVQSDLKNGIFYLQEIAASHVSGQLKIAPEHSVEKVLEKMGKPGMDSLLWFKKEFEAASRAAGKNQFLTYYLIAAHPGCTSQDMLALKQFVQTTLKITPEQVQIFTPTPSTYSSLMYYTGLDPFTGQPIFVEKDPRNRQKQKDMITGSQYHKPSPDKFS